MVEDTTHTSRKLSKNMRRANLVYQVLLSCLGGLNLVFIMLDFIPEEYFEVLSVLESVFPVVWTHILDACKQYVNDATPSSPQSPSTELAIDSTKINSFLTRSQSLPQGKGSQLNNPSTQGSSPSCSSTDPASLSIPT